MKTLRARLVSCYSILVTLTVALALLGGFYLVKRQLLNGTDFLLEAEFQEIKARLDQLPQPVSTNEIEQAIGKHTSIDAPFFFFQVHDKTGRILYRSANLGSKILPDLTPSKLDRFTIAVDDLGVLRIGEFESGPLHAQIATSMNQITALSKRFSRVSLIAIPSVLLFSVAIAFLLCEITLRPLRNIEQTARRISVSNLKERIPKPRAKDEIGRLSELLNAMFDRLEQSFEQIKQFTADFSHELRTPLSIIALHTERVLKSRSLDPECADELTEVLSETRRLNQIIDQLLTLAKAESQTLPLDLVPNSTSRFINEFAEDATALAEASGKTFDLETNEELTVKFDKGWIRQVLFNLLSNAIKFSPQSGEIRFSSRRLANNWQIAITDQGPGIPSSEREAVFERFKQLRGRREEGTGLGLAVSKSIVGLHCGQLSCGDTENGIGTVFTLLLPIDSPVS